MKCKVLLGLSLSWSLLAIGQQPGFGVEGIGSVTIPVTLNKMTNIVFPEVIQTGVKVSREVLIQKVKGVENVIELKAARKDFTPTNLSVYGRDGRLYSFVLHYVADTAVLNYRVVGSEGSPSAIFLSELPTDMVRLRQDEDELPRMKGFLRVSTRSEGLKLRLTGIYVRDSLEWLAFSLSNRLPVDFRVEELRFYLQDKKQVKRKAGQELAVEPVCTSTLRSINQKDSFAAGFQPFVVPSGKWLIFQIVGKDGRRVALKISRKLLLKARRV